MGARKRIRTSEPEAEFSIELSKFIQSVTRGPLSELSDLLTNSLKMKSLEIRTLSEKIKYMETSLTTSEKKIKDQSEVISKLRDDNYNLTTENEKLLKACDKCEENSKTINEQKKQIEECKKEEERFKSHIFRRQVKLREMKTILATRDEKILDLQNEIEKVATRTTEKPISEDSKVICDQQKSTPAPEDEKGSTLINEINKFLISINSDASENLDKTGQQSVKKADQKSRQSRGRKTNVS